MDAATTAEEGKEIKEEGASSETKVEPHPLTLDSVQLYFKQLAGRETSTISKLTAPQIPDLRNLHLYAQIVKELKVDEVSF